MAELDFEASLSRLYAQPPAMPDAELFTARVAGRLDRGWALRRIGIAVAGGAVGVIGAAQLLSSRVMNDVQVLSHDSARALTGGYDNIVGRAGEVMSLTGGGEVMWMAAGLAVLALAFGVTRVVNEF